MLKKPLFYSLAAILILALILSGCGGGKSSWASLDNPAVYAGGYYVNTDGVDTACYWDAGGRHDLGDGSSNSEVLWLSFYNDHRYAVGYYYNVNEGKMVPCYWIDGVRQPFVDPAEVGNNAYAACGFVYNGQVYAGGWYNDGTNYTPCYWDEGGRHDLSKGQAGEVHSIFVDGSGVYAAGRNASGQACYWDNQGDRRDVSGISGSLATQIVVDANRVYLSGYNGSGARYWVSDGGPVTEHSLNGVEAYSIFVRNNRVYVGGFYSDGGKEIACYWDNNGVRYSLANPDSDYAYVNSIFVYNNKVYAAGDYDNATEYRACYWDDMGRRHDVDVGASSANCILAR